ncbi:uncharacterized protein LOC126738192 [Anthonomus grandis grandis]|uniref:uncharacterized protein LOC126738192 n=1 Tax=Anthonomus grandis grandis TaxID=2921223 RepID=UPI0021656EDB|nr:uncharacterized protein LOC126738192 [Anthonomus grandis grandis]
MFDNRKKLSGAQYRKQKLEKEELTKKACSSLQAFLIPTRSHNKPSSSQARDQNVVETICIMVNSGEEKENSSNTKTIVEGDVLQNKDLKQYAPNNKSSGPLKSYNL